MPFNSRLGRFLEPPVDESPDKSYVTLERNVCRVCGRPFDTGALLMDQRLRNRFEMHTVTGWGMCPDDQKKYDEGYIALVEAKNPPVDGTIKPEDADRTGVVIHVRESAFKNIFSNLQSRNKDGVMLPMAFIDHGVVEKLMEIHDRCEASTEAENHDEAEKQGGQCTVYKDPRLAEPPQQ
jgi:hypothetical protein